jgi:hypothetical protein
VINGVIDNGKEVLIKGCSFTNISSNLNGGGIYVDVSSGGRFTIENSEIVSSLFYSCSTNGKGGGIYLKLGSVITGFLFSGGLLFRDCNAAVGKNI